MQQEQEQSEVRSGHYATPKDSATGKSCMLQVGIWAKEVGRQLLLRLLTLDGRLERHTLAVCKELENWRDRRDCLQATAL